MRGSAEMVAENRNWGYRRRWSPSCTAGSTSSTSPPIEDLGQLGSPQVLKPPKHRSERPWVPRRYFLNTCLQKCTAYVLRLPLSLRSGYLTPAVSGGGGGQKWAINVATSPLPSQGPHGGEKSTSICRLFGDGGGMAKTVMGGERSKDFAQCARRANPPPHSNHRRVPTGK